MNLKDIRNLDSFNSREFLTSLPQEIKPEWLEGVDTNFHFDVTEGVGAGQYSVIVKDNTMEVFEHFEGEPRCKITAKEKNLFALLKGELNPMMAVFSGKVKVSNPGEVLKYAKLFGLKV